MEEDRVPTPAASSSLKQQVVDAAVAGDQCANTLLQQMIHTADVAAVVHTLPTAEQLTASTDTVTMSQLAEMQAWFQALEIEDHMAVTTFGQIGEWATGSVMGRLGKEMWETIFPPNVHTVGPNDVPINFTRDENGIRLMTKLMANRFLPSVSSFSIYSPQSLVATPTRFQFILNRKINISKVVATN